MASKAVTKFVVIGAFLLGAFAHADPQVTTSAPAEGRVVISNKYCTAVIKGNGGDTIYSVIIHILNPQNGSEVNSEYVAQGVTKEEAFKLLDSRSCG